MYTATEISRMTDDALDELLADYQDKGHAQGAEMVQDEITARCDERLAEAELEYEAEQERKQMLHDEMINERLIEENRWG
jgi:hypothetical protein